MGTVAITSPVSTRAQIAVSSHLRTMALLWIPWPCHWAGTCSSPTPMTRPVRALCTTPNTYSGTTTNSCAASSLSTCFIGKNGSQQNYPPRYRKLITRYSFTCVISVSSSTQSTWQAPLTWSVYLMCFWTRLETTRRARVANQVRRVHLNCSYICIPH